MNPLSEFLDLYFAFLLSGDAQDFHEAHNSMVRALNRGATWSAVQDCMKSSQMSAELLTVLVDTLEEDHA